MALLKCLLLMGLHHAGIGRCLALLHGLLRDLDRVLLEELVEDIHALLRRCRSQRRSVWIALVAISASCPCMPSASAVI